MPNADAARPDLLGEFEAARRDLRATLGRIPAPVITQRGRRGQWSIYENVRHLLFAEQLHMGRLFGEAPAWSPLGYTPASMRALRKLPPPEDGGPTLKDVLTEWDRIHRATMRRLKAMPLEDYERAVTRHLAHLRSHVREIEKVARQAARDAD
jgi:hypothetical protein